MPQTAESAGYDFVVAEDTLIPPYEVLMSEIVAEVGITNIDEPKTIDELAVITKATAAKPILVPTGIKAQLDPGTYLELSVRSSCPLKYWLVLANGVGVVDGDYYNNPSTEGEIFFQLINFSPIPIILKKGDVIGQGIIKPYLKIENDNSNGERVGGFGSTN